jgi:hypothetical protein
MSLGSIRCRLLALALASALGTAPLAAQPAPAVPPAAPAVPPAAPVKAPGAQASAPVKDIGWPRQLSKDGVTLVYYQPQLDEWQDYRVVKCRMAFSLTPKGGKPILGVASLQANTLVDKESRTAFLRDITVTSARFPSADAATADRMEKLFKSLVPKGGEAISVDRIMAMVERDKVPAPALPLNNAPPPIFYSAGPALLLLVDGEAVHAPIEGSSLEFVVNANWDLFYDRPNRQYFLLADKAWLTAKALNGPWTPTRMLPADIAKLPAGQSFDDVKKQVPPPAVKGAAPQVFFSSVPAELIVLKGAPVYAKIAGTGLLYLANTDSDIFVDDATKLFYVLLSGRWFRSNALTGPWVFASAELPQGFARIPEESPRGRVLSSVPGTQQAADAVMLSQIPTSAVVDKAGAEAGAVVNYDGPPQFKPIERTQMLYAVNSDAQVIRVGDLYYLCFQGVWFVSRYPTGPWKTADSVPQAIYTIPPASPVYNVTYVTQTNPTETTVECSHTSGYFGMFVVGMTIGATIAWGTGYYYPPYYYHPPGYGYPVYRPWPRSYGGAAVYNPRTGGYAVGRAAYGPYGAAGSAAWYNPQTGRYGRTASVQGWYGGKSTAATFNPRTGVSARTTQADNAYAQWGSTVAKRGNDWVQTGHVTTRGGTTAGFRTSSGESGVVRRGDNGTVARTENGVYAGRDGNVYKRDGGGGWSQYENGNWNKVDRTRTPSQDLDRAASARERGQRETQRNFGGGAPGGGGARGRAGGGARGGRR